nr:hypothetical protein [Tanacetum cinerariifolium]
MEDQPLPTNASPTALLPGYINDSNLEEDEEDPEEDPVDYPANGGDNDDNKSSDDDDDTMQDAIKIATKLMNKKISTLAEYQTENKKRLDNTSKNNQNQHQQPNKRQNTGWVYTAASGKRKEYAGTLPLCNKYKFHHNGQCTVKCVNCKRVSHLTRDDRSPVATNNHRNPTCYECRNQGQYRSDCPELKNQDHGNQSGATRVHRMVHALGG